MFDYILFSGTVTNDFTNDIAYQIDADEKTDIELEEYIKQTYSLGELKFFDSFSELELYVVTNELKDFFIYSVLLQQVYSCVALADMFQLESSFLADLKNIDNEESILSNIDFSAYLANSESTGTAGDSSFISDTENLDLSYQSKCDITLNIEHTDDEDGDDFSDLFGNLSCEADNVTDIVSDGDSDEVTEPISSRLNLLDSSDVGNNQPPGIQAEKGTVGLADVQFVISDTIGCEVTKASGFEETGDMSVDFSQYKYYPNMSLSSFLFTNLLDSQPVSAEILLHYFTEEVLQQAEVAGLISKSEIDGRINYTLI